MADQGGEGILSPLLRFLRLRIVRPYLRGMVLDVGCGSGVLASVVQPGSYLGVDVDEEALAEARRQYPRHNFQSFLPPAEPVFDTVIAMAVIEHVLDSSVLESSRCSIEERCLHHPHNSAPLFALVAYAWCSFWDF